MFGKMSILWISILLLITSCAVGPNYVRPAVMVPLHFKEAKGKAWMASHKGWKKAKPNDDINRGEWWKLFGDERLNALEAQLTAGNQSLASAAANYRQADAIVGEARANLFPNLGISFNGLRQTIGNGTTSFTSSSIQTGTTTGTATTGGIGRSVAIKNILTNYVNVNWQPDIWGQVRRTIEADESAAQASGALWAATRLSLQGSLAQYYFELRAIDKDQALLDSTVASNKELLQLTKHQYASGVAALADIVQAQSQLEMAEAAAINNGILRSQYEHAIAVLIGVPPANFSMPMLPLRATPPAIPVAIPSVWLERRPDVAQAERLMQQTNALLGAALSTYYPNVNLAGSVSGSSTVLSNLFAYPVNGWSLGLVLAETIFDGGLRSATVRAARAAYEGQVATYRQTVLTAFQNVEDMLAALRILEKQGIVEKKAEASAKLALKLVINQYKSGTVPYSSVVSSQISAYTAEKNAADVVGLQMTSAVALIMALGGGWNASLLCTPNAGVSTTVSVDHKCGHQ